MAEAPDINVDELRRRARRRLIGAIVLALAAAVLVPMLLESDPKPLGEDVSVRIPPEDNAKFVNRLTDKGAKTNAAASAAKGELAMEPAKTDATPPPAAPAPPAAAVSNVPAPRQSIAQAEQKVLGAAAKPAATAAPPSTAPAATPAPSAAPRPPEAPATSPPVDANKDANKDASKDPNKDASKDPNKDASKDAPKEGFSVQLAAFADDKGANALANKLKRAAYPAYTEPLTTSKGTLWRVRVGPYPSREAAIDVRDKLKGEGYSGIVAVAR
jgi:DedD protein